MKNNNYKPKPFTQQLAEQAHEDMYKDLDKQRTLCNVIKQAFRACQEDSFNLKATRDLLLEALWMGQRMSKKLSDNKKLELQAEQHEDTEEYTFCVDWSKFNNFPARGNHD